MSLKSDKEQDPTPNSYIKTNYLRHSQLAIKPATQSAFSAEKSALSRLRAEFNWELGYLFTDPAHAAKGIGKNIARLLVDEHGKENLMASTEISANPRMVKILEALGFRHYGKSWKSAIHK